MVVWVELLPAAYDLALLARQLGFVGDGLVNNFWEAVFHTNKYVGSG